MNQTSRPKNAEFTLPAILLGMVLSILLGAANVYLGLKIGMTVAASIPAVVVSVAVLKGILGRGSILESNLVQTAASAGESLAAGVIFVIPAFLMIGAWTTFNYWTTTLITAAGGILGVLLMIPMRKVFVEDNDELPYPEGVACAEVLWATDPARDKDHADSIPDGTRLLFGGVFVGMAFKFVGQFLGLFSATIEHATHAFRRIFVVGFDISPALLGVGLIVGPSIAGQVFLGGALGWFLAIPLLSSGAPQADLLDQVWTLWSTQIRYMGVGAMVVGGITSIWSVRQKLIMAIGQTSASVQSSAQEGSTSKDISLSSILIMLTITALTAAVIYRHMLDQSWLGTGAALILTLVVSFFISALSSYIIGLVGSSNSPVSGMTISALLITALTLKALGLEGMEAMVATLGVAGMVCAVACISGDTSNDLKTGLLVGASPRLQQIMQILGVLTASLIMAPVLVAIHEGSIQQGLGGIGGKSLPAPQAGLFASIVKGFFGGEQIPWNMVLWGALLGMAVLLADQMLKAKKPDGFRLHVMPVAVGIYLPVGISAPLFVGGLMAWMLQRKSDAPKKIEKRGILISSGIIAGESLLGVGLAVLAYFGIMAPNLSSKLSSTLIEGISIVTLAALVFWMVRKIKAKSA